MFVNKIIKKYIVKHLLDIFCSILKNIYIRELKFILIGSSSSSSSLQFNLNTFSSLFCGKRLAVSVQA